MGLCFMAARFGNTAEPWQSFFEAALFAWLTMVLSTYVLAQILYRKTSGHWLRPARPDAAAVRARWCVR